MAAVTIDSGDLPSAKGKKEWELERVLQRWQSIADGRFEYDCRALLQMIDEVDELRLWEYAREGFYKTRDEFLQKVVLIDFDLTEHSFKEIVGRLRGGESVKIPKLGPHGGDRNSEDGDQDSDTTLIGRGSAYLLARLDRDHKDVLARYEAGEFKSVAAAARAAGIKVGQSPLQKLRSAWKAASSEEREIFAAEILNP